MELSVAVITMCSRSRLDHVRNQQRALLASSPNANRVVVWLGNDEPPEFEGAVTVMVPPGPHGMRLAAGRNAGAAAGLRAGAELLLFLDADCIPAPGLIAAYVEAGRRHPGGLLVGAVTYLPEGFAELNPASLAAATRPHPARPAPQPGVTVIGLAHEYPLFWSLSFAVGQDTWELLGGFDEAYEGYGGEDTDFAFKAREHGVPLVWVGGADAYHQYHPTTSPPWQHLDAILRNGALFARRWGEWPMGGWLTEFAEAGAVVREPSGGWVRDGEAGVGPITVNGASRPAPNGATSGQSADASQRRDSEGCPQDAGRSG